LKAKNLNFLQIRPSILFLFIVTAKQYPDFSSSESEFLPLVNFP
jgi:hypothetical protein